LFRIKRKQTNQNQNQNQRGSGEYEAFMPQYDYIIASECVYLEKGFEPLIETLIALSNDKTDIIMAYEKRRKADDRFFKMAKKHFQLLPVL